MTDEKKHKQSIRKSGLYQMVTLELKIKIMFFTLINTTIFNSFLPVRELLFNAKKELKQVSIDPRTIMLTEQEIKQLSTKENN